MLLNPLRPYISIARDIRKGGGLDVIWPGDLALSAFAVAASGQRESISLATARSVARNRRLVITPTLDSSS